MNWNAVTAIGTCLAAFVGIAGIWLNLWDKTRKLNIYFEGVPHFKINISNNSQRTAMITKVHYSVKTHIFHVEYFSGLRELTVSPATTQSIYIPKQDIYNAYFQAKIDALCNPDEKIVITLFDNYGRKYTIKTNYGIGIWGE